MMSKMSLGGWIIYYDYKYQLKERGFSVSSYQLELIRKSILYSLISSYSDGLNYFNENTIRKVCLFLFIKIA